MNTKHPNTRLTPNEPNLKGWRKLFNYLVNVRHEVDKVTWPSRQEVIITTVVVFALACVCAIFFALVDTMWYRIVQKLIGV